MLLPTPNQPVILGHSWLRRHNPNIDWSTCSVQEWGVTCQQSCLRTPVPAPASDISGFPAAYHYLREAFNKAKGTSLPPNRPYDCAIDLLPGTSPPVGMCSSGGMLPGPSAIPASSRPGTSCSDASGGRLWGRMSGASSMPALYATGIRPLAAHKPASCIHCPSPIVPGRISPWTL